MWQIMLRDRVGIEPVIGKVESISLRQQIAEKMRAAILNGSLHPGQRLVERKLADECQTSVTGVREALIELESDGFVIKKPGSATHVINLSVDDAEKIFAVRRVLETFAV